jgi:ketosteroid isomerase-like protein
MRRCVVWLGLAVSLTGCAPSVNVDQERTKLLARDREWSQTTKDPDKFASYLAADAAAYPQGMPLVTGSGPFREMFVKMSSAPGFALQWMATKADVSTSGDLGYTAGTYEAMAGGMTEKGKYVTVWKKQADGSWKVTDDIFNADTAPGAESAESVLLTPGDVKYGQAPPGLPPGAKMAVVSGDPSKAEPFVIRAQMPAGYKIAPHWHPTTESLTVLSGTVAVGMGDKFDQPAMKDVAVGGFTSVPGQMHHFFMSKTASTIQVHGMGPFAINYVNPADDPSQQKK